MKLLKWLVIVTVVAIAGLVGVGLLLPDTAHVERSIVMKARASTVYTVLNGFLQFQRWSPWAQLDPQADYWLEGPLMGVGAKMGWLSESPSVGSGSQEIIAVTPNRKIEVRLIFEGFDGDNLSTFAIKDSDGSTQLIWSYDTTFGGSLIGRYFGLMMDRMVGPDYERGLAQLKTLVESLPNEDISTLDVSLQTLESQTLIHLPGSTGPGDDIAMALSERYARLRAFAAEIAATPAPAPIAITRVYDEESGYWQFDAGLLLGAVPVDPPLAGDIEVGQSYGGSALVVGNAGQGEALEQTYHRLMIYREIAGLETNGDSWEQYASADLSQVRLFWPVAAPSWAAASH